MKYTSNDLNLLKYAIDNKVAFYVDAGASIERSYESNGYLNLKYNDEDTEKIVTVNFGSDASNDAEAEFLRVMRLKLPIVEILDLVTVALVKGLIKDESDSPANNMKPFREFEGNYNLLTSYDGYFVFSVVDDSGIKSYYNINFNSRAENFPRKLHVEYVSRSSMFVKAILDKVMYKYNILIVAKAALSEDSLQPLPLADEIMQLGSGRLEDSDEVIENEIHGQIKVLISYRDTINNESYSERVIDDIYVDKADTDNPEFNVSNIHPTDNDEGIAAALHDIPQGERDAIVSIHKLFDRDDIKFRIFEKLRESPYTALHRLIARRFRNYEKTDDGAAPRVEFTITPIAIYSNHIVKNIKRYKIAYKDPPQKLRDFSLEYEKIIEPNSPPYHEIAVDGEDAPVVLSAEKPLVIAMCNNYNTAEKPLAVLLPLDDKYVVRLDKNNRDYYGGKEYVGVYFDKRTLVIGSETGYDKSYADKYFIKDDLEKCAASGKLYYKDDLRRVEGGIINSLGYLNKSSAGSYVYKDCVRTCPTCRAQFGAEQYGYWKKYLDKNILDDGTGKDNRCCDKCIGLVLDGKAIFKDNSADNRFYTDDYDDGKGMRRTALCPCCLNSAERKPPEEMTVDVSRKSGEGAAVCRVCGKTVCKKHFDQTLGVCSACKEPSRNGEKFDRSHPLWKPIKRCLRLADRRCDDMVIDERSSKLGELRLFCKKPRGVVVYYMYIDTDGKNAVAVRNVTTI